MAASIRLMMLLLCLSSMACASSERYSATDEGWRNYVVRFITEGRVIDTGNNNVSHTEGQGWAMLMAVAYNDPKQFEQLWRWTNQHLRRSDDRLFSWRYDPSVNTPIADINNASDGDLMIAWALSLAGQRWNNHEYHYQALVLRREIRAHLVRVVAGYTVLLPAKDGFVHDAYTVINLSYFVIPAIQYFAILEPDGPWTALLQDSKRLLESARFGTKELPADWAQLTPSGNIAAAPNRPVRFGFEAVRIPLYFFWGGFTQVPGMQAINAYWQEQPLPPAWVDLESGESASFPLSGGGMAVRQLLAGLGATIPNTPSAKDDYYSASLLMLARLAANGVFAPAMY